MDEHQEESQEELDARENRYVRDSLHQLNTLNNNSPWSVNFQRQNSSPISFGAWQQQFRENQRYLQSPTRQQMLDVKE